MTRAPAARARAAVSSIEPASVTSASTSGAARRSRSITASIRFSSFSAGTTTSGRSASWPAIMSVLSARYSYGALENQDMTGSRHEPARERDGQLDVVPGERPKARDESIVDDPPPAADGLRLTDAHVAVARPCPERRGDVPRVELDATVDHGGRNAVGEEGVETGEARAIPGQIVVGA